jgi:two-component system response regulator BaeR
MDECILIVEDEPKLAQVLGEYVAQLGLRSHWLAEGKSVIPWVREHSPALIILDLMLPGRDGVDIFHELRTFSDIPVMMATAKVDEIDRLLGLELGADDYVCKPYSPRELMARVKNILRRSAKPLPEQAADSGIQVDVERMEASINGYKLKLTPVEFRLLKHLFTNPYRVYSRAQLLDYLYDDRRDVTDRTVDSHIKNLRRKLQSVVPESDFIKSIYGMGYKLEF